MQGGGGGGGGLTQHAPSFLGRSVHLGLLPCFLAAGELLPKRQLSVERAQRRTHNGNLPCKDDHYGIDTLLFTLCPFVLSCRGCLDACTG